MGIVVASGLAGRLRVHIPAVILLLASLAATIYLAQRLGRVFDIAAAGAITPVHLSIARVTALLYVLPVITGVMTYRNRARKPLHRAAALLVLALTVLTAVTGAWMVLAAPRW